MTAQRPLLAVVYDLGAAGPMDLGAAADGLCDLAFVCDPAAPHVARSMPVLRLLGAVVPMGPIRHMARQLRAMGTAGVVTFADRLLPCSAALARLLGLPHHSPDVVAALSDKLVQRRRLAKAGIDTVRFAAIDGASDAAAAVERVGTPAVLKPRRGTGSRSTSLVRTVAECVAAVEAAVAAGETGMILEEYLAGDDRWAGAAWGDYASVESLVAGGRIIHFGVTGKTPLVEPFRETGCFSPSTLPESEAKDLMALAAQTLVALGAGHGICHTEFKLTAAGPRLIEVNGRLGGHIDDVVSRATGWSPLRAALEAALGCPPSAGPAPARCVAYQVFVTAPAWARSIVAVSGVREARALPGVRRVAMRMGPGDAVDWRRGTGSAVGTVHGETPDHAGLLQVLREVERTLVVRYA